MEEQTAHIRAPDKASKTECKLAQRLQTDVEMADVNRHIFCSNLTHPIEEHFHIS